MSPTERDACSESWGDEQRCERIADPVTIDRIGSGCRIIDEQQGARQAHAGSITNGPEIEAALDCIDRSASALDALLRGPSRTELDDAQRIGVPEVSL
jgi:hypothetical protein